MKLNTSARSATILWRVVNLMLVACLLFGLGALGTAAGENEGSAPSVEPRTTAPRESRETTGEADTELERAKVDEDASNGVTRLAEEPEADEAPADKDQADVQPFAPPLITREAPEGPLTIGDTIKVDITVTVDSGQTMHWAKIRDDLNRKGAYYVKGSATLTDVSGTPVQGATLVSGKPNVGETKDGAKFTWKLEEPVEAGAEAYVFKLSYQFQYTGVKPANDKQEMWLPDDDQKVRGTATLRWWNESTGGPAPAERDTNDSEESEQTKTHIDQPLLAQKKFAGANYTTVFYPGWYVYFNAVITNPGWSTAHNITWKDKLPDEMGDPLLLEVSKLEQGGVTGAGGTETDITDQVTADFTTDKPTIDFNDVTLDPSGTKITETSGSDGDVIIISYMAWVDWFFVPNGVESVLAGPALEIKNRADVDWTSMPGDVKGERKYKDKDWEHEDGKSWKKDTAKATITIARTEPQLTIYKDVAEDTPDTLVVGDEITYDITVMNSGQVTATIVPISDRWNAGQLEFVSATVAPDSTDDGEMTWYDLADGAGLAPDDSIDISATFKAVGGGNDVQNRAYIEHEEYFNGPNPSSVPAGVKSIMEITEGPIETIFEGNVAIAEIDIVDPAETTFVKSADPVEGTIMLPGEKITYTVTGSSEVTRFNALITDTLDSSVEYVPGSIRVRSGSYEMTITDEFGDDPGGYDADTRTVYLSWPFVPTETPGELIFDVVVRDAQFSKQGIQNTAQAWAIPENGEDERADINGVAALPDFEEAGLVYIRDSNTVYHPVDPFEISKTGEDVNGGLLVPGDEILWTVTVVNTGITPTTNVVVSDTVPEHTTYKADSITGVGADDSGNPDLVWNVGQMPVDGVEVCTFISTVDVGTPDGTQIINQAAVESDQSFLTFSDSPTTAATDDATLLQTGQNDWLWLGLTLVAAGLGTALTLGGRKWLKHSE